MNYSKEIFSKILPINNKPGAVEKEFFAKVKSYLGYISWLPGLRMVGVGNSIAMNYASQKSDIDLFIVTTKNSMWFNRIFITLIFQILGVRKNAKNHAGRFCLSFFATESDLSMKKYSFDGDVYMYFWCKSLVPVLNYNFTYEKFVEANFWATNGKSNLKKEFLFENGKKKDRFKYAVFTIDKLFKMLFLPKTKSSFNRLGKPFGVVISDTMLKFHDKDKRKEIAEKYAKLKRS